MYVVLLDDRDKDTVRVEKSGQLEPAEVATWFGGLCAKLRNRKIITCISNT